MTHDRHEPEPFNFDADSNVGQLQSVRIGPADVKVGDRVRIVPRAGGDIIDIALDGKVAMIQAIEQDYEGRVHLAVVVDEDPGRDMGFLRQPGHRFFFSPQELWPIDATEHTHG